VGGELECAPEVIWGIEQGYRTIVQTWADAGLDFTRTVLLFDPSKISTDPETEATYAMFKEFARKDLGLDREDKVSQGGHAEG
jgi:hypothetical protein